MATLNATKWGFISGPSSQTFTTARENNGTSTSNNPSTTVARSVEYIATAGRGSLTHHMYRSFFTFDVSGIAAIPSTATLNVRTSSVVGFMGVIALKSSAFGGSNSNLVNADFFTRVDYTTAYSTGTAVTVDNPFQITLNSTARGDIKNNSWFIVAVVQFTNDYSDTAATTATTNQMGIDWSVTPYLDYTLPSTSDIRNINGVAIADVSSFNAVAIADIASINGVDN